MSKKYGFTDGGIDGSWPHHAGSKWGPTGTSGTTRALQKTLNAIHEEKPIVKVAGKMTRSYYTGTQPAATAYMYSVATY